MTQIEINENLKLIRRVLDLPVNQSEPGSLIGKLEHISAILGLSAEVMAYAEKDHNIKLNAVNKQYDSKNSTERKIIFGEAAKYEIFYQSLSEKYNKELHYQIDLLRTLISYTKKDFEVLGK